MGVNDSIRAYNGVISWINKNNIDLGEPLKKTRKGVEEHLNNIWIQFGKEHNLEMSPNNNPKYKGSFSPQMYNCTEIQASWTEFKKWVLKNYKQKTL